MSRIQNGKNRNPEKPVSGCLGRMVNLFDLNTAVGGNKLLTDKPHHDGSSFSRRQSDASRTSLFDDQMDDKLTISDLNRKSNCTPIKMLIAQEMSKEDNCKQSPSNLVAKLMGLEALPRQHQPDSASRRSQSRSLDFLQQENGFRDAQKGKCHEKQKMDLVREKFMEAKRLSTDENLRQSKQFQEALEVLSSNKDLFLKFLQEPNPLFSQNLYNFQSVPPPDSRRITVLRPSKSMENHKKKSDFLFSQESFKIDNKIDENPNPTQPTRIVVLKPNSNIKTVSSQSSSHDDVIDCDPENLEEITNEISDNFSQLGRDETLISSVLSNGYIGDDSSCCKSEIDYTNGNLSDSEIVSPISRHSWDYINRFSSHYSASSSYSPDSSSVCREAKKRLSERWVIMANNNKNVLEHRESRRSSSTLGDMLALSDMNKIEKKHEIRNDFEKNLLRSKSLPETNNVIKEKLVKSSSFKGKVSNLFFSKNKKLIKDKSDPCKGVPQATKFVSSPPRNDMIVEEASCSGLKQGINLPTVAFSLTKPGFPGNPSENQDQPSPISVLEPQFEDDHATECNLNPKLNEHGIEPMKYNLIDKSPPIGSIARTISWDDSVGSSTPYTGKPSPAPLNPEQEGQEYLFYIQTLFSISGLDKIRSNSFLGKWHSSESPLDPSLRDKYMNLTEKVGPIMLQFKQRHQRSVTKLVFDCVNEALVDIAGRGPCSGARGCTDDMVMSSVVIMDCVWAHMKEWFSGEERWDWEEVDGGSMVVERVVNKEVVGRGWGEGLRVESENIRKEIERKLLEELVSECVLELTGRC